MPDSVRTQELAKALKHSGFSETRKGSHMVFRHGKTGLIVTLPAKTDKVPQVYLRSILRQLSNYNISHDDDVDKLLNRMREGRLS